MTPSVTKKADLRGALTSLGITSGDTIVVHSSLSSLGHMQGGARAVCEVLMDLVTASGVVLMPSFNHGAPFESDGSGVYDPRRTTTTNGQIADTFWRMDGVYRSLNPTHAFAVWGDDALAMVKDHHRTLTMGQDSPLHKLEKRGGKAVFIDCLHANTHHHVVEMTNDVACLGKRTEEYPVVLPSGEQVSCRTWGWRSERCPVTDEGLYRAVLHDRGLLQQRSLANATISVVDLADSRLVVEDCLFGEASECSGCQPCEISPRTISQTVPSDWDGDASRVVEHTTAFVGNWNCASTGRPGPKNA